MTAHPFDPLRAAREELAGLHDVHRAISTRERKAVDEITSAESELNALRRISGYVRIAIDTLNKRIAELEKHQ